MKDADRRVEEVQGVDDEHRFRLLYDAHYGAVLAYARRRTVDSSDAFDVAAETFTVAWRRVGELPSGESALPWLYGVARRVLANQRRSTRRRADLSARLRSHHAEPVETESQVLAADDRRSVLAALDRLKDSDREILRLAAWEELSHREIATIVECSEASVAVRLHRARNRLGKEIEKGQSRTGQQPGAELPRPAEGQDL